MSSDTTLPRRALYMAALLAAPFSLGTPALAADRPGDAARVKACTSWGAGFYYIPGTDTCLSIGGYVWAEGYYNSYTNYPRTDARYYSVATYGLQMDARSQTEYGTLRSFIEMRLQYRGADEWSSGPSRSLVDPRNAYVNFAGLTLGLTQSFFDFYANQNVLGSDPATIGDQQQIMLAAYSHDLGYGWTATLSLEDATDRAAGLDAADPATGISFSQQSELPDLVVALGQSSDWGQFQFSGALHEIRGAVATSDGRPTGPATSEGWGYAVQAGIMFNLPTFGAGDTLYLQSAYVDGAASYLGLVNPSGDFAPPDAYVGLDGSLSKVTGWNATAQLLHNWTPQWQTTLFGGYARFDLDDAVAIAGYGASSGTNYNVGGNIVWSPLAAFSLILQYQYNVYEAQNYVNTGHGLPVASQEAQQLLFMAQRTF